MAFVPDWLRGKVQVNQETIQQVSANAGGENGLLSREPEGCGLREASWSELHPIRDLWFTSRGTSEMGTDSAKAPGQDGLAWH